MDVGAGNGILSRALADVGARVVAVELDPELASRLAHLEDVRVIEADARAWQWPREPFRVVSNLPFAGSTGILSHLLRDPGCPLQRADVIVQWELAAKRAALWPATLKTTYWQAWYELTITHRLSRTAFAPAPTVDAAVLSVTRRAEPLVSPSDHVRYWRFLASAFERHPTVARAMRPRITAVALNHLARELGFSPRAAPRDLDARQWAGVFAFASGARTRSGGARPRSRSRGPGSSAG